MKYLSREQMRRADQTTIKKYGIPALILMENAGRCVAEQSLKLLKNKTNKAVLVICGKGNNGGDGFVAARHLYNSGIKVKILYLDRTKKPPNTIEAAINFQIINNLKIPVLKATPSAIRNTGLIIDAIFGIGLTRPIESPIREIIDAINTNKAPVLAIDIPSGLDADTGKPLGIAIKANVTVTLGAPKIGFLNKSARPYIGKVVVADIGIPEKVYQKIRISENQK
ncbi:MAG: NAD(P)H-hydrate epimerase [Planctomycetes bacterium]|nr:NAD(P)H-hydrate epimerase [Planctomycetota bacterium]